jgi:hypothetical protein
MVGGDVLAMVIDQDLRRAAPDAGRYEVHDQRVVQVSGLEARGQSSPRDSKGRATTVQDPEHGKPRSTIGQRRQTGQPGRRFGLRCAPLPRRAARLDRKENAMPSIGMKIRGLLTSLLLLPGGLVATSSYADEPASRWTFGTELGYVSGTIDTRPLTQVVAESLLGQDLSQRDPTTPGPSPMSYDASVTWGDKDRPGWRVFTGYRFTDYLAIHVGYTDLGKARLAFTGPQAVRFSNNEQRATQSVHGVDVGLQLKIPLHERVDVELNGGRYYWKSSTSVVPAFGEPFRISRRDSERFFGAGLSVGVVDDMRASVGWTRYEVAGEPITLVTVGLLYGFSYF